MDRLKDSIGDSLVKSGIENNDKQSSALGISNDLIDSKRKVRSNMLKNLVMATALTVTPAMFTSGCASTPLSRPVLMHGGNGSIDDHETITEDELKIEKLQADLDKVINKLSGIMNYMKFDKKGQFYTIKLDKYTYTVDGFIASDKLTSGKVATCPRIKIIKVDEVDGKPVTTTIVMNINSFAKPKRVYGQNYAVWFEIGLKKNNSELEEILEVRRKLVDDSDKDQVVVLGALKYLQPTLDKLENLFSGVEEMKKTERDQEVNDNLGIINTF